jgi:glycine amidinotransferase
MLVIGDEIIETPMVWPCRYFETHSYRPILKDYFRRGARWTAAPKPQLTDELFDPEFCCPEKGEPISYILTEFEPVFDAADFFRCGRDLFVIRSNVTNASGIEWLRRHLDDGYQASLAEERRAKTSTRQLETLLHPADSAGGGGHARAGRGGGQRP